MSPEALQHKAVELRQKLVTSELALKNVVESVKDILIAPGMSEDQTKTGKIAVKYVELHLKLSSDVVATQCEMFDICVAGHLDTAPVVKFFNRMTWAFTPKSLVWWIILLAVAGTAFLYDSGVFPK